MENPIPNIILDDERLNAPNSKDQEQDKDVRSYHFYSVLYCRLYPEQ